ncbi:MAG: L,D-transpeptidase family protein [Anaerolineales bacterium]|nr:L,D-transpeptidase family protein [Anaerolineales bacterium]
MNDSLSKLRKSTPQEKPQGGVGLGNRKPPAGMIQAKGPVRSGNIKKKRSPILPILLVGVGGAVFLFAAWSAVNSPVLASILSLSSTAPQQEQRAPAQSFAQVAIAKPTYTPAVLQPVALEILPTATPTQEPLPDVASLLPTSIPTDTPFVEFVSSPAEVLSESVVISAEIIPDTPTPEYAAPTVAPYVPPQVAGNGGERWIDVDLSQQRVYAYEGDTLMNSFLVSTGTWQTPTVTGKYKVWIKVRSQAMSGPGYYLPDVPYVMFFYKGYGFHGTYWHNNFGTPMSHGCVNLTIPDAEWLYNFSSVGTVVNVHY